MTHQELLLQTVFNLDDLIFKLIDAKWQFGSFFVGHNEDV